MIRKKRKKRKRRPWEGQDLSALYAFRKKRNDTTQGRLNHGKRWTEQEIALIWDADCAEKVKALALLLHRSYDAIRVARYAFTINQPRLSVSAKEREETKRKIETTMSNKPFSFPDIKDIAEEYYCRNCHQIRSYFKIKASHCKNCKSKDIIKMEKTET